MVPDQSNGSGNTGEGLQDAIFTKGEGGQIAINTGSLQAVVDEIDNLQAQIDAGIGDIQAAKLQLATLEDHLAEQMNALEPSEMGEERLAAAFEIAAAYTDEQDGGAALEALDTLEAFSSEVEDGVDGDETLYALDGTPIIDQHDDTILYTDTDFELLYGDIGVETSLSSFEMTVGDLDIIADFNVTQGDVLDLSSLIQNYDSTQKAIDDFIFFKNVAGGSILSVDTTGSGDISNAIDLVALQGMHDLNLHDMLGIGALIY